MLVGVFRRGIEALTVYALSTENATGRQLGEVQYLYQLLERTLGNELQSLQQNGIRLW